MGHGHDHGLGEVRHERPLWWALGLTGTFLVVEVVAGLLTNSLALLSDASHMATDTAGLVIALVAVRLARRPPDARRTFGYARLEALGALANGVLLLGVAAYILWEAVGRFRAPPPVAATGMLLVAVAGLVVNLIAMRLLKAGSGENLNVKGAYLEVWSDMLGSLGVLIAAALIKLTGWLVLDPILAVLIGLWVLPRTWVLMREALHALLNGVPAGIDLEQVRALIASEPGVAGVHDLHVWSLGSQRASLTAHVLTREVADMNVLRRTLTARLIAVHGIQHSTLQLESDPCEHGGCAPREAHDEAADDRHDAHRGDHDHD
jgi:cobalt-zinc-cadmium efflux system protein